MNDKSNPPSPWFQIDLRYPEFQEAGWRHGNINDVLLVEQDVQPWHDDDEQEWYVRHLDENIVEHTEPKAEYGPFDTTNAALAKAESVMESLAD